MAQRGWIIFETEKRGNFLYSTLYKIIQDLSQCFKKYKNVSFEFRSSIARKNCLASASSVHSFCQLGCSLKYNPFMKIYNTQNTSTKLGLLWDRKQLIPIFRLVYFEHKNSVFSSVPRKPKNSFCKVYKNCVKQVKDTSCCCCSRSL